MQAVILVIVSTHVRDGTASEADMGLYTVNNGSFVQLMPKSILISSLTMLKTWYELVQEVRARRALGLRVRHGVHIGRRAVAHMPPTCHLYRPLAGLQLSGGCTSSALRLHALFAWLALWRHR